MSAPSKHRDRQFFLARGVFGLAAIILVGLVVFIAVRAGGDASASETPVIVQPSANLQAAESTTVPLESASTPATAASSVSPSASASTSPSASASASPTPSKSSASPKPSKTSSSPKPSKTTTPPAVNDLSVSCSATAWGKAFITNVKVTNHGSAAHNFVVTVSFPSSAGVTSLQGNPWNAQPSSVSNNQVVLKGNGPVAGGGSVSPGFIANKNTGGDIKLAGCSVAAAAG